VVLLEQSIVILLLERDLVSYSSAINEQEDLYDSDYRSVISYVHGRIELYCSNLVFPCEPFFDPLHVRSFYTSRSDSYIETHDPTGGLKVVETLYNM
jgi:hypothetical protein